LGEYGIALKTVLRGSDRVFAELNSGAIERSHNVELPEVRSLRLDMLGETSAGGLVHIELQSKNDEAMALRILEYCAAVYRHFRRFPEQIVLYVGNPPMQMSSALAGSGISFTCRMVDIRELDGERLLQSERLEDNVIALLARLYDQRGVIRRILGRIARCQPDERDRALKQLRVLVKLRGAEKIIEQEVSNMPIDEMDFPNIVRDIKLGELNVLLPMMEQRFGTVPAWAQEKLQDMYPYEIVKVAVKLLAATSVEEMLGVTAAP
jgi:hypothetical protein